MRDAGARTVLAHGTGRAALAAAALIARHRPYVLPVGGSSEVGIRGFEQAGEELAAQISARTVIVAVGSGGSAAGLARSSLNARIVGVVVNDRSKLVTHPRVDYVWDFLGPGYGHPTPEGQQALRRAADAGLALEPVYTAKAMAAALALDLEPPAVFWNTYGGSGQGGPPQA
jgi:D-cysteine desulfhydrase